MSTLRGLLIGAVCLLVQIHFAYAQAAGELAGTVTDLATGKPLANASIVIHGTAFGAVTGQQGSYFISGIPDGTYTVVASLIGFRQETISDVKVSAGQIATVHLKLTEIPIKTPDVIVTAARKEETVWTTSASVDVLTSEQLEHKTNATFDQALQTVSGISVSRSSEVTTQALSIRGASSVAGGGIGNRVLLLLDGCPIINADTGGANWNLIPLGIMGRVEVVKGAYSALYGSHAMGGVINILTKSPTDSGRTRIDLYSGYYELPPKWMRYTNKRSMFSHVGISRSDRIRNWGYFLYFARKSSDGYRQNTDFSFYNLYGKLEYHFSHSSSVLLTGGNGWTDYGLPHIWKNRLHPLEVSGPQDANDRRKGRTWNGSVAFQSVVSPKIRFLSRVHTFSNNMETLYNPDALLLDPYPRGFSTKSDAQRIGQITQLDITAFGNHSVIVGVEGQMDLVDARPDSIMYGRHQVNSVAAFGQDEFEIAPNMKVTLGARYDYRKVVGGKTDRQFSPKFGMTYRLFKPTTLRFSVGRAFRAPSLAEMYLKKVVADNIDIEPNLRLGAEKLWSYEIGLSQRILGALSLDLALFDTNYSDMISWEQWGAGEENTWRAVNLERANIKGIDLAFRFRQSKSLSSVVNYTYLAAKDLTPGREEDTLPYRPKHTLSARVDCEYHAWRLNAEFRYVTEVQEVIFWKYDEPAAFQVIDGKVSYRLRNNTMLSLEVANLLDQQYEELARYRMPGRSYTGGVAIEL